MIAPLLSLALLAQTPAPPQEEAPNAWRRDSSLCATGLWRDEGAQYAWLPQDSAGARQAIWERRGELPPLCLYEGSSLWRDADPEKALRLYVLGSLRAAYDMGRCRSIGDKDRAVGFLGEMTMVAGANLHAALSDRAARLRILAETALAPGTYVYESDLADLCREAGGAKPQREWKAEEDAIRARAAMRAAEGPP
jgi:hypothetical protein